MSDEQEFSREAYEQMMQQLFKEFRENDGKVGGPFKDMSLCLLTTVGAKSGERRTVPLGYLEIDGQPLVVGSAGGGPKNPGWYYNVLKNPKVTVEYGAETFEATAGVVPQAEHDELFAKITEVAPGYADYQAKVSRSLPIVTLTR